MGFEPANPGVSIVIPAWNEDVRLRKTLGAFIGEFTNLRVPFEIIVVTDGNSEPTRQVAASFERDEIVVLSFTHRLGKGGAILKGIQSARFDSIGFIDADGPVSPRGMLGLAAFLDRADCVVGSRFAAGAIITYPPPLVRRVLSQLWSGLVRLLLQLPVSDTQCGAKFFRREALTHVTESVRVTSWAFDIDLLFQLNRAGFTIIEAPVTWTETGGSRLVVLQAVPQMLLSLAAIWAISGPLAHRPSRDSLQRIALKLANRGTDAARTH